jgi:hypothetical protein
VNTEIMSHDAKIALCYPNSNSDLPVLLSKACPSNRRGGYESSRRGGLNTGDKNPFESLAKPTQNRPHLLSM